MCRTYDQHWLYHTFYLTIWIVRLPIALLQLPVAFGNTMLRTMAILAFLLAASSLISASFFIASKEHLLTSAAKRERWINASICPKLFPSIDFWLCLSWPVTSFVWWVSLRPSYCAMANFKIFTYSSMQVGLVILSWSYLPCHDQWTRSFIHWCQQRCCAYPGYLPDGNTHLCNILPHFKIPLEK